MEFNRTIFRKAGILAFFIVVFFWNTLLVVSLPTSNEITIIPVDKEVDSQIQQLLQDYEVPSLAVGIVLDDTLVWAKGYGDQPSLDTVYMLGSIQKPVIATAILQLVEDGALTLDDDMNNYLPFEFRHPTYPTEPITIQMCLSHRSCFLEFPNSHLLWDRDPELVSWVNNTLDWDIPFWTPLSYEEYMEQEVPPLITNTSFWIPNNPDSKYQYSNSVFQLILPYIIQNVTGQSFNTYVHDKIFTPLEMENSGFNGSDFAQTHAKPYLRINSVNIQFPDEYYLGNCATFGAALRASLPDLANFMIAHMNQGKYEGFQLLSSESIELMHTKYTSWRYQGNDWAYGLGWRWSNGGQGHGGAVPGFLAEFLMDDDPNPSFGIIHMFNRGSSWVHDDELLNEFQPSIRTLLFEEARRMSSSSTIPGFSFICSILVVLSLAIWYKRHFL